MSYGVGWFGRVFGTLGMFGSVVFFCNGGMFGAGVFLVRDGPPPRNLPSPAGVLGAAPPHPQRTVNRNGKRPAIRKKNAYF